VASVPLLDLQAQYQSIRDEILATLTRVCDSQRFIMGPEVEGLERELAELLAVKHAVGVTSGTDALLVAMMAFGIGPGDEVVTSTYSFFATAGCVARLGATPVFVDIDPVTYNLDPAAVAAAITPRTKAIIPVHLYGQSADLDPILAAAARAGVPVIEDGAQAIGARYRGRPVGGIGTVGCFSFFPSKNLGAFGDGGLVTTNDGALAAELRRMRVHGADRQYYHQVIGGNFRLDALQAAVLRVKLPYLPGWTEARRRNAARYAELFAEFGLTGRVTLPAEVPGCYHIYNQYVVRVPDRDAVKAHLEARHVGCAIYYPVPFHEQVCFAYLGHRPGEFPHAEKAARETLALPVYGELTAEQQRYVVAVVAEALGGAA
jgi:dTDP-4-amino-4,6-dideoxygalactose transaminase